MSADGSTYDALDGFCSGGLFIVVLQRLHDALNAEPEEPTGPAAWAVTGIFAFSSLAFACATPALYLRIDTLTGVHNGAAVAVCVCAVMASALFQVAVVLWDGHDNARARVVAWLLTYLIVILALIGLFRAGATGDGEHPLDFAAHYAPRAWMSAFLLLYYVAVGLAMGQVARLCLRYSRGVGGWVGRGRGLRWIWIGALLILGDCMVKVVFVVAIVGGLPLRMLDCAWAPVIASLGATLIGVGLTMPTWGPPATAAAEWARRFRDHATLYPLWLAMVQAHPEIALEPASGRWTARWRVRDLRYRLVRLVIEIMDGRVALRPYAPPQSTAGQDSAREPADRSGTRREAAAREAALLGAALREKRQGRPAHPSLDLPDPDPEGADLAAQQAWLLLVAREFAHREKQDHYEEPVEPLR